MRHAVCFCLLTAHYHIPLAPRIRWLYRPWNIQSYVREHLNIDVLLLPGRCLNVIVRKARISAPFQSRILHGVYGEWVELSKTPSVEISICSSLPYHVVNCLVWHSNTQHDPGCVENNSVRQRSFLVQLLLQLSVVDKAHWTVTWCEDKLQKYIWFRNISE